MSTKSIDLTPHIQILVESGVEVTHNRYHLYRSSSGEYVILNFNPQGKLLPDHEESFIDLGDAVAKFLMRAKL